MPCKPKVWNTTLEGEAVDGFMECEWQDWDDTLDEAQSTAEIPSCLIRPFSEIEPVLSESELAELDYVADQFELARLSEMGERC